MSTTDESVTDESIEATTTEDQAENESESSETEAAPDPNAGAIKALGVERAARKAAEKRAKDLEAQIALKDKPAEEQAIEQARREAREEAQSAFNKRLVNAELKAALAGKVNDTALALKVIDSSVIDVGDDGEVDPQSVTDAIDAALREYPVLKPTELKKFGGTADQGTKGKVSRPQQLTREELKSLTPDQVVAAEAAGQLDTLMGR